MSAVVKETADTVTLRLPVPLVFLPGQFAMLGLHVEGKPVRRSYSIASAPNGEHVELTVKAQEHGLFSRYAQTMQPGHELVLYGPFGNHFLFDPRTADPSQHLVFVAGGSGISPFRSMLQAAAKEHYTGRITLLYSSRSGSDVIYREELEALRGQLDLDLVLTLTRPTEEDQRSGRYALGRVTPSKLQELFGDSVQDKLFYICGPTPMVQHVQLMLQQLGVPKERVKTEKFGQIES